MVDPRTCDGGINLIRDGFEKYAAVGKKLDANWERAGLVRAYLSAGRGE